MPTTERLFAELGADLRRYVLARLRDPVAADDVVQDVFLRIHERIDELRDADRVVAWVYRIARSAVVDHVRRQRPVAEVDEDVAADASTNVNDEVASWLPAMLAQVPDESREALELCEVEGLSQKDLAGRLGISASGAKSRVQRGRAKLAQVVLACCHLERDRRGNVIDYEPRPGCCT